MNFNKIRTHFFKDNKYLYSKFSKFIHLIMWLFYELMYINKCYTTYEYNNNNNNNKIMTLDKI